MPKIKLPEESLAVARVLAGFNWSHSRIAHVFCVNRSTVSHALNNRKTKLPDQLDDVRARTVGMVFARVDRAARKAVVHELRQLAAELSK